MNEIPDLKKDIVFLKKFDSRINAWMDIKEKKKNGTHKGIKTNFHLHPRRLNSDSESLSAQSTPPTKIISATVIKHTSLDEPNNNVQKRSTFNMSYVESGHIINFDAELCLDRQSKSVCKTKPPMPTIANSNVTTLNTKKCKKPRPANSVIRFDNFDKKYTVLVEKCLKLINNTRQILEKGLLDPDGEEDLVRRLKRLQEFSSRFSRNYLYPLLRLMEELNSSAETLGFAAINQKFLYAQQVILNGLQAYYNYLPSSVGKCCSDKLKTLLEQIISLCHVYDIVRDRKSETTEFVKALRSQTEFLIQTVDTFNLKIIEKNKKANEAKKEFIKKKTMKQHHDKKKSKLSMYAQSASFRNDMEWKKATEVLAKKKFNVKSKYKTSVFKHRPPVEKPHFVQFPSKVQLYQRRSSTTLKSTPIRSPIREDEIRTMVETELEIAAPPNTGELVNHENSVASSVRLAPDSDREIEGEDSNVKRALEVLKKFLGKSAEDQAQFFEKIADEVDKKKKEKEKKEQPKMKLPPVVTVTGVKNAQLICIRDDNSVVETEDEDRKDKEIMTDVEIKQTSSETQTDLHDQLLKSRSSIKICRLPKTNRRPLKLLPKEYAIDIIQYKLRYAHYHKENPMYRKSANVQPWILMGRISEDILDYILQSVTSELEVSEILENLYNAEFQY